MCVCVCIYIYIHIHIHIERDANFVITNIIWYMANKRGDGERSYIAQWSCNSIAIVWQTVGGVIHG